MDRTDLNALSTRAAECGICRAAGGALTDVHGAAVCERCLRRIDASPHEKRQVMFAASESLYW
jgi:hypothetical protein